MTIEQKALELVNAVDGRDHMVAAQAPRECVWKALCRAIEAHEADKARYEARTSVLLERDARHAAEMREQAERFSEAAKAALDGLGDGKFLNIAMAREALSPFILAPVDPLAEVMRGTGCQFIQADTGGAELLRQVADRLGYTFAIVKKEAASG